MTSHHYIVRQDDRNSSQGCDYLGVATGEGLFEKNILLQILAALCTPAWLTVRKIGTASLRDDSAQPSGSPLTCSIEFLSGDHEKDCNLGLEDCIHT